ncbi:MAG: hypothetical protein JW901_07030 [Dehalococcoidia bacterium]|nr:hypothetical protein [Dehalococcoidia bacterium]
MKCAVHPDIEALGACCNCGSFVCPECKVDLGGHIYCNRCLEVLLKTGSWPGQTNIVAPCAPGMGEGSPVPEDIKGWSWGGFLLTWIWGIGNNVWIALIALLGLIPYVGWIASLAMSIVLGIKGSEWAWQHKKWESIEHFKKVQRSWAWWGLAILLAYIVIMICLVVLAISLYMIAQTAGIGDSWKDYIPWQ